MKPLSPERALVWRRLKDKGINFRDASLELGMGPTYVQQYVRYEVPRALPRELRSKFAAMLGLKPRQLAPASETEEPIDELRVNSMTAQAGTMDLPLYGTRQSDDGGVALLGAVSALVWRPSALSGNSKAYAIISTDMDMFPFRPGCMVYVDAGAVPKVDDDVLVSSRAVPLEGDEVIMRQLVGMTARSWRVSNRAGKIIELSRTSWVVASPVIGFMMR